MTVRPDIAELLHAGYGDRTIARHTGVTTTTVTRARTELGLPKARRGHKPAATPEDLFWRRTTPTTDGHLEWAGTRHDKGTPYIHWGGKNHSAYRIAYRIQHGTDPHGYAFVTCTHDGCIAPAHIGDSATSRRPAHHRKATGRRPNATREQIIALLKAGHSDKAIGKQLRTNPKRVAQFRAELGIPAISNVALTFEDRWAANTEPVDGGHIRWTGRMRDNTTPAVLDGGRDASVRRIAFERLHGRTPVGPVLPGCGWGPCVRPEHLEDRLVREHTDHTFAAIFGEAA